MNNADNNEPRVLETIQETPKPNKPARLKDSKGRFLAKPGSVPRTEKQRRNRREEEVVAVASHQDKLRRFLDSPADAPLPKGATKRDVLLQVRYELIKKSLADSKLGSAAAAMVRGLEEQAYSSPQSHPADQNVRAGETSMPILSVRIEMPDLMNKTPVTLPKASPKKPSWLLQDNPDTYIPTLDAEIVSTDAPKPKKDSDDNDSK